MRGFACALISCLTALNNGFDAIFGKIKGWKDFDLHGIIATNLKSLLQRYIIKRLLTVYRKIFGTRSYGGDALVHPSPYELVPNILQYTVNNL